MNPYNSSYLVQLALCMQNVSDGKHVCLSCDPFPSVNIRIVMSRLGNTLFWLCGMGNTRFPLSNNVEVKFIS